jgi:hypothetical protein
MYGLSDANPSEHNTMWPERSIILTDLESHFDNTKLLHMTGLLRHGADRVWLEGSTFM